MGLAKLFIFIIILFTAMTTFASNTGNIFYFYISIIYPIGIIISSLDDMGKPYCFRQCQFYDPMRCNDDCVGKGFNRGFCTGGHENVCCCWSD
ncbi:hypothetical protein DCAR_0205469 [Daucus carota subsp. sativus]|uniref:Knottin scorpion toxin-like domain-containing protein n=1 Tax=Daucus carota subsp. sativus TaxID=79200 RepID=A0AAF0WDH4_DAUCS|nr:hypothetical protein DCAR_0205469 [Daucus carota subsp. sativus]